jgi:AcrR family transcriptional regulator
MAPKQAERHEASRASLITAARIHFAHDGFDVTHTNDLLDHAGVSPGAIYHQFQCKRDLFEAVVILVSNESFSAL